MPVLVPRATLVLVGLVSLVALRWAALIWIDSSVDNLLSGSDPALAYYHDVRDEFGSEEATVIGMFADDVFSVPTLAKIERLTTRLAELPGVQDVLSLSTARGAVAADDGLESGRLMSQLPRTPAEATAFRQRMRSQAVYRGILFGDDDRSTALNVFYEPMTERAFLDSGLDQTIRGVLRDFEGPEDFAITGMPTLRAQAAIVIRHDLLVFVPLSIAVVTGVLTWFFRSPRGVLLPLGTVLLALLWTTAFMVACGGAITFGTLIVPPLLIAIGSAYAIHVMNQYQRAIVPKRSAREVVEQALSDVRLPLAVAGLTTLAGFLTFVLNPIPTIREFGLFAAFGVTATILLSLTFLPAALTLLPVPSPPARDDGPSGPLRVVLDWAGRLSVNHGGTLLVVFAVVSAISILGTLRLRVETDYLRFFPPDSPVRMDTARIARDVAGTQPVSVVIEGHADGALLRSEVFPSLIALQAFLDAQPEVDKTISFVDYLTLAKRALLDEPDASPPVTGDEASQLLLLIDPAILDGVVTPDFSRASILLRTRPEGSQALRDLITRIERALDSTLPKGTEAHVTGSAVLLNRSADDIVSGQVRGLQQVLLVLLIIMSILFLSVRIGAVSLIPNLFPIIVLFGVMGWSGISLNLSTSLIATIAIGIALDDTIHFLSFFNAEVRRSADQHLAAQRTLRAVGPAIVVTSIALTLAFVIVALSGFVPIRHFGLLTSFVMLVALSSDLLLTPALVQRVRIVTLWDALRLRLGPAPQHAIPMFAGLRPFQARLVVLMSQLATAEPGTLLTRRGEMGDTLFVLLSGVADVSTRDGTRTLRTLTRGDVVGEMGLLRRVPRSADVVVRQAVEYLVVDEASLERLRRRYPRTAAIVFRNLARILSDRLDDTTAAIVFRNLARILSDRLDDTTADLGSGLQGQSEA